MPAEYLAALAALCWAFGSLFSATAASQLGAFSFTRWRLFFALVLLWAVALYTGQWRSLDGPSVAWLALSGLIGIFIGDTALFACMNRLGPRRSGVLFASHALFSACLAWGLLAALCQSVATLMIKPMMTDGMDAIAASAVRTSASFLAHAALWWAGAQVAQIQQRMTLKTAFHTWASATIAMGVGMTLILQALKTGPANLVGLFSSLSPVLLLPLLWGVYRRRPAVGAWCGAAMAVLGSALILRG